VMINGIIGKKVGMTQIFAADGTVTPVTVIKAGPCVVVQKKTSAGKDGYNAVQLGLVEDKPVKLKNVNKPMRGHFEKTGNGIPPTRILKEFRADEADGGMNMGDERVTVKGLTIARVDVENNLLMVRGAVPGATGSVVVIKKSARQKKK